jgi:hypothetical protein
MSIISQLPALWDFCRNDCVFERSKKGIHPLVFIAGLQLREVFERRSVGNCDLNTATLAG